MTQETIFALSTGSLPSGVAVIRVSGPAVPALLDRMVRPRPLQRRAALRQIKDHSGNLIDTGLVLFFPAPNSFTGEDCLEFQVHGGRAVITAIFDTIKTFPGTRMAEPGEFTRRAFENGKIDLVEAEGLADLLAAETEMQRRLALEQIKGGHSNLYGDWADRITHARAMIEAELDFADEEDIPGSVSDHIWSDIRQLVADLDEHLARTKTGEIVRDGLKLVIFGAPNSGKSSLINQLAQRNVAIVTAQAGTTRDIVTIDLDIRGYAVRLFDTAGIRDTEEEIEQEGIRRARIAAEEADLILHVIDLSSPHLDINPPETVRSIRIGNKVDLQPKWQAGEIDVAVSAETGEGIDELKALIGEHLAEKYNVGNLLLPARARHVELLLATREALTDAYASSNKGLDVRAEYLRRASASLGRITGRVDVEDLLGVIFSEFCVGK